MAVKLGGRAEALQWISCSIVLCGKGGGEERREEGREGEVEGGGRKEGKRGGREGKERGSGDGGGRTGEKNF